MMCGLVGFFNFDGAPVDARVLSRMVQYQNHRGPDDQGMRLFSLRRGTSSEWKSTDAGPGGEFEGGLGFNRLSILDLSSRGHQPMANDDGSVFIAFNGEIYNAFDFTAELEAAGFVFRSRTDTEVILRLYERFGLDGMLARLSGMFAIVIVDLRQRLVHIARDHFGVKPLYWARQKNTIFFGSEMKSFQVHPDFVSSIAEENIDEYMAFRYCAADRHLMKTVNQLRPGHCLSFSLGDQARVRQYYKIPDVPDSPKLSRREALDGLDAHLQRSVKSQLLADVKVGCQLSGGIDSSLTTLYARKYFSADMDCFSIIFDDPNFSEAPWIAQAAAAATAVSHRFTFRDADFFDNFERATWHLDQPINHPNSLGIYLLAEKSRPTVTVLLSGEGADELMGGYPRFFYADLRKTLLPWLPMMAMAGIRDKLSRALGAELKDDADFFMASSMPQRFSDLSAIRPQIRIEDVLARRRPLFEEGGGDFLRNCLKYDMQTYMVDLLVRQDKMTMAHSMENRVPFLDRDLVAFVRSLPMNYLVGNRMLVRNRTMRNTKILLKQLARRTFDEKFVYRPKSGFGLPLLRFYQDSRFVSFMEDKILPGMKRRGIVNSGEIERTWRNISRMPRRLDELLWTPIAFEMWAQQFLDSSKRAQSATCVPSPA
jgi:asparagine synthase (glutamine-hydrolysing)